MKCCYILIALLVVANLSAQQPTLSPFILSSTGGSASNSAGQLSWSVGETFITTGKHGNAILTQGFLQPELQITTGKGEKHYCTGSPIVVSFTASGVVDKTNVYTAELSDKNGNFANATVLGTLKATDGGTINGVVPAGAVAGSKYRIRVRSSMPQFVGTNNGHDITINTFGLSIPDVKAYTYGVSSNTIYHGWSPASAIELTADMQGNANGCRYEWRNSQGKIVGNKASLRVCTPGDIKKDECFTVTVSNAAGCVKTVSKTIKVVDVTCMNKTSKAPGVMVCVSGETRCIDNTNSVASHLQNGGQLGACSSSAANLLVNKPAEKVVAELPEPVFTIGVAPNPSASYFTLKLSSDNKTDAIAIRVIDNYGRLVEAKDKLTAGQTLQLGAAYRPGTYFVLMMQGQRREQVTLLKVSD